MCEFFHCIAINNGIYITIIRAMGPLCKSLSILRFSVLDFWTFGLLILPASLFAINIARTRTPNIVLSYNFFCFLYTSVGLDFRCWIARFIGFYVARRPCHQDQLARSPKVFDKKEVRCMDEVQLCLKDLDFYL